MVLANILSWKTISWLLLAFMGLLWVFGGLCGGWWVVGIVGLWGVSIIREWGKDKANPLEKHKKNLTRVLKK